MVSNSAPAAAFLPLSASSGAPNTISWSMGPVTAKIMIDAPRERVFSLISNLALRPSFCDHFQEQFHLLRIEPSGVGAGARFHVAAKRFPVWMETVVVDVEAPRRLAERGKGARQDRVPYGTAWELSEGSGETTEITVTFWSEEHNQLDAARSKLGASGWYQRQWKKALKRLRDIAESEGSPEPIRVGGASRI